ncbi:MAG: hypothetical protein IJS69_03125, partial [Selenomonadaceae bacterium]|nr:hypothetical protein [Selenomonadaceae bacterium]
AADVHVGRAFSIRNKNFSSQLNYQLTSSPSHVTGNLIKMQNRRQSLKCDNERAIFIFLRQKRA